VLVDVAKKGLPGEHHFKITFNTTAPGVKLSDRMREQYPETMTVVLQHQFWDLTVNDDVFEVGLSFGGVPERITIPFDAVTAFFDPAVQFGLQFETMESKAADDTDTAVKNGEPATSKPEALPTPEPEPEPDHAPGGAEVVRLDRFRKK
jgi:hypothetical protein